MIRSATDFLPLSIRTLMNLATSMFANLGSGRMSRFGTSRRRGIFYRSSLSCLSVASQLPLSCLSGSLGPLGAVLRTGLLAVLDAGRVERAAHHVVAHAGQVLDAAAPDQHHRVLLQVVAFAADVADDLEAVGETNLGDLPQCGIRLLGSRRVHTRA